MAACVFAFSSRPRRMAVELRRPEDAVGDLGRESRRSSRRARSGSHPPRPPAWSCSAAEGTDRLEQRIALARRHHAHESLLDQRVELVERAVTLGLAVADLLHRLERPAFVEDGGAAQQLLLGGPEEGIAPADRGAQRCAGGAEGRDRRRSTGRARGRAARAAPRARGCAHAPRPARGRAAGRRAGGRSRRSPRHSRA